MRNLDAIYFPDEDKRDQLTDERTSVNTFRIVFNAYFNSEYEKLDDRMYCGWNQKPYYFEEVTDHLILETWFITKGYKWMINPFDMELSAFLQIGFSLIEIFGYIDPSSSSAFMALIIGAIAGIGILWRCIGLKLNKKYQRIKQIRLV